MNNIKMISGLGLFVAGCYCVFSLYSATKPTVTLGEEFVRLATPAQLNTQIENLKKQGFEVAVPPIKKEVSVSAKQDIQSATQESKKEEQDEVDALVGVLKGLPAKSDGFIDQHIAVIDKDIQALLDHLEADNAKEALDQLESLEKNIEKEVDNLRMQGARFVKVAYENVAVNANSLQLKKMIQQKKDADFFNPNTLKSFNDEIANMLFRAKDRIYTLEQDVVLYYVPLLEQLKTIVERKQELKANIARAQTVEEKLALIESLLDAIPGSLPSRPVIDEATLLDKLRTMELK